MWQHAATSLHSIKRRNFTECFNRSVLLARLCISPCGWLKTETCRNDNYVYFNINFNFSKFNENFICWLVNNM